jgi:hypothetical protein
MHSRYAIVGRWYADPHRIGDQNRELRDVIVPMLRARPGFVAGYWTRDPDSGRTHATILFSDENSARDVKAAIDADRQHAALLGITNDYLIVADVLAEAPPLHPLD